MRMFCFLVSVRHPMSSAKHHKPRILLCKKGVVIPLYRIHENTIDCQNEHSTKADRSCRELSPSCSGNRNYVKTFSNIDSLEPRSTHILHYKRLTKGPIIYIHSLRSDVLCDLVIRVPGYRSRGSGFDSRRC
jgi:hypothetical protein